MDKYQISILFVPKKIVIIKCLDFGSQNTCIFIILQ